MSAVDLRNYVRTIRDFPTPGIQFRDLTPLMGDAAALSEAVSQLVAPFRDSRIDAVAGIEARGFIFGALAAAALGAGFVPLRKAGKLPAAVERVDYALEYGSASLDVHRDALAAGKRVLLVDDVLATGGTAMAGVELMRRLGADIAGAAFVLEITALAGRAKLDPLRVQSVLGY
jgi:adenine phosphoribosyltransferase